MTQPTDEAGRRGLKSAVKGLIMLGLLGALVFGARALGLTDMLRNTEWFASHVLGKGPLSFVIYVAIAAGFTAVGMPRQVVAFLGGFAFGVVGGTVLSTLGCAMGCGMAAAYARFSGRDFIARKFGPRVKKVDHFLSLNPFRMALCIRLFPLGSNLITNLAAGVSSISLWSFMSGSAIGYIPQNFVFALFGSGLNAESDQGVMLSLGLSAVLFAVSGWMGVGIYRRYRAEASFLEEN